MALPTKGRVIIDTTVGEVDIELWSKETPKTCRNFLQLAMEGYYDGVIFHRVVPGFLVQTGDKTGTGAGGESIYGEPFEDEIHPRLRFAHRGLVAMANNGTKNSNDSQFIITLDRADELHGKHTLFGRVIGDTVYNVMKIGEMELDKNERPVYPPKIKNVRILDNPFPDIIPRITAAEKRAQQRAREEAQKEREEEMRRRGAKKNVKLLSFGADEGEDQGEEEEPVTFKKKAIFRPDLVDDSSSKKADLVLPDFVTNVPKSMEKEKEIVQAKTSEDAENKSRKAKSKDKDLDITKIREQHASEKASSLTARQKEIEKMEADIRKLAKKRAGEDDSDDERKKKPKKSYLEEELSKYAKGRGLTRKMRRKDEGDVLAKLEMFRDRLQQTEASEGEAEEESAEAGDGDVPMAGLDDPGMEIDDDRGFLGHKLYFPKDDGEESRKAERDYEVIDPRQRGARAREEERERKNKERGGGKPRHGGQRHGGERKR
ncbi:Peptidyl-prolyl isomerase cwc27 [Paramarasmius palmivorus]|uniref:Peptidyl-prolyl isomerase CWC27 n=1 Tax=Paramarasmius palmivorus TaxID=297713 RepID=A0AAW0C585_9AGAR